MEVGKKLHFHPFSYFQYLYHALLYRIEHSSTEKSKHRLPIYIYKCKYKKKTCILGRTYFVKHSIHSNEEHWLLIITGGKASGVIVDHLLRQCCFVWSEIVGTHSSGDFNDWPLKLKTTTQILLLAFNFSQVEFK